MSTSKDNWKSLPKKNNPYDPLTWAKGKSKRDKNWYHLTVRSCKPGALIQPEHVCFILSMVLKDLEQKLFKGEEE
jgi:hypothetical protein